MNQANKTPLFKHKTEAEKKSIRIPFLLTKKEAEKIKKSANNRQLSVAEFVRRAALRRTAGVNYNSEITLTLREIDRKFNELSIMHITMIERGIVPPVDYWLPVKEEISNVVGKIAKRGSDDVW